jgi:glutathione S-transferase
VQLIIGNKNYSSWSMRPWVLMKQLGIAFDEVKLRFDFSEGSAFRQAVAKHSPAGKVPVLVDSDLAIWDTLAITEYLAEKHPGVWPADRAARARARSLVCEMHSGFSALRNHCPMNIEAQLHDVGERVWAEQQAVRSDVARVDSAWSQALAVSGGPFLFGAFSAADAFYAPVCMRLLTYGLPVSDAARAYVQAVAATSSVAAWIKDSLAEQDYLDFDEPYRKQR